MQRALNEPDAAWHARLNKAAAEAMGFEMRNALSNLPAWHDSEGKEIYNIAGCAISDWDLDAWSPATDIAQAWMVQGHAIAQIGGEKFSDQMLRYWVNHVRDDKPDHQWDWRMNLWLLTAPPEARCLAAINALEQ